MTEIVVVQDPVTTVVETTETEIVVAQGESTEVVEVGIAGPQGPQGDQGDPGPQGDPGADGGNYTHAQAVPASTWTIVHNLGYRPGGILVLDTLGRVTIGDVSYPDVNTVQIDYSAAFSGTAYLS